MTITLDLAPDLEALLRRRAAEEGEDEQALALRLLADTLTEEAQNEAPTGRSMSDLFAGRVGLVSGSGEAYSEDGGRRFAEHLARKHR